MSQQISGDIIVLQKKFQRDVLILPEKKGAALRKKFIRTFVDTKSLHFRKYIQPLRRFSDGLCYEGYLWDCLIQYRRLSLRELLRKILRRDKVCVLWDIHSSDRILVPNYWLFPKKSVLQMSAEVLVHNLVFLPRDLYIFDDSFSWALILTHEYDQNKRDIFFQVSPGKANHRGIKR